MKKELNCTDQLMKQYCNELVDPKPEWPIRIKKALLFIHEHLCDKELTIHQLREHCYNNSHDFSTLFANYLKATPSEYIIYHRLELSKLILSNEQFEKNSILSIAIKLGFSGSGAFNHAFKKHTGMSPGKWRKQKQHKIYKNTVTSKH